MDFSWPITLGAIGGLVAVSALVVWGVRLLARQDRHDEEATRLGVDIAAALTRDPRTRDAAILPVVTLPLEGRPSVELTGRVRSAGERDVALETVTREVAHLRPGLRVIDRLEVVPAAVERRSA